MGVTMVTTTTTATMGKSTATRAHTKGDFRSHEARARARTSTRSIGGRCSIDRSVEAVRLVMDF